MGEWTEALPESERVDSDAAFVIFRKAGGLENAIAVRACHSLEASREYPVPTPFDGMNEPLIWRARMSIDWYSAKSSQ